MFAAPNASTGLTGKLFPEGVGAGANTVKTWMEMLVPDSAEVLASYDHPQWGEYAAVTRNSFGAGTATYIGCMTEPAALSAILRDTLQAAGLWGEDQQLSFPLIIKSGVNRHGSTIRYYYNYSAEPVSFKYMYGAGQELLSGNPVAHDEELKIEAWGVLIISQ
jgi:beta-galactosidase